MNETPWKQYPMRIEEAAEEVLSHLSEENKREITNTPKCLLMAFHDGLGRYIRNNLGLWDYFHGREKAADNPDRISFLIIESLWELLQKDARYLGVLRHPGTGEELPEEFRHAGHDK